MDSNTLWLALGLAFVIEGLFPFLSPTGWRKMISQIHQLNDGQVRFFGLCSMLIGLLVVVIFL